MPAKGSALPAPIGRKIHTVIQTPVSCPGFNRAKRALRSLSTFKLARNDEMHEIPNLPFPSLNQVEQPAAPLSAEPAHVADSDGDENPSAEQE
ncbi:hypothetical protein G3436_16945 [Pseudomonas sp. MAFF212427]|uniref:Uncharacterized protein n=1 Tax=Pseudomonas brassicae TaxID=2708063 RepID=A0A6B3NTI8_9PSED|nr:hypothetical protein [Pseudomonas brassicae]NER65246.1 hypothetical protein [Pseudomonas brassicae]